MALTVALTLAAGATLTMSSASAAGPVYPVMNTSETPPDGVWFRNSPRTGDTPRITGLGVYQNERVALECHAFGEAVGKYANRLWYRVSNVSRPSAGGRTNSGYLNAHYVNDGKKANETVAGVPSCDSGPPPNPSPPPTPKPLTYVALGDSFSSGEGNAPYASAALDCHRSTSNAWPVSVRNVNGPALDLTANLACSGAVTGSFTTGFKGQAPQAQALSARQPRPDYVTITIGGNDVGFSGVLRQCFLVDCWRDGSVSRARARIQDRLPGSLREAYGAVRRSAPSARIMVLGYPQLFPGNQKDAVNCGWLTETERIKLNELARQLDEAIKSTARASGFDYVSALSAVKGHELCTKDSWMHPIKPNSSAAAHPTPRGQSALAATMTEYLKTHRIR